MVNHDRRSCGPSPLFIYAIVFLVYIGFHSTTAISIPIKRSEQDLSVCEPDAICGTVQVTSRGFTAAPLCSCPDSGEECPLVWDITDRRSITQGSMQYKHCKATPPRRSSQCMPDQTAYAMKIITPFSADEDDGSMMKISHRIYCTCGENYQHIQQGEDVERIPYVGEIKTYSMTCAPFPVCGPDESCKSLSETKTQFMENELCRCAEGTHCPVAGNHKAKSIDFGLGRITQLYCQ